jgi:2-keto-3-deoxy-L-rhamnonate aldolase RhmA
MTKTIKQSSEGRTVIWPFSGPVTGICRNRRTPGFDFLIIDTEHDREPESSST